jgi:hypothetical protein
VVEERPAEEASASSRPRPTRRILVVANETVAGQALLQTIEDRLRGHVAEVLVVCPALTGRVRRWFSDVDHGVADASQRLEVSLAELDKLGIAAEGRIGDSDPVQAIEDALRVFDADEIVVSTHPPGRSNWLERRVVERARERFRRPVTHVGVDLEREGKGVGEKVQHVPR